MDIQEIHDKLTFIFQTISNILNGFLMLSPSFKIAKTRKEIENEIKRLL